MRKTALIVPEGMALVPGLSETTLSELKADRKVTKWMKLLLQRGRVVISLTGTLRLDSKSSRMNSRCSALIASVSGAVDDMLAFVNRNMTWAKK